VREVPTVTDAPPPAPSVDNPPTATGAGLSEGQWETLRACFHGDLIRASLEKAIRLPAGCSIADVAVSRFWVHARDRFTFEYELALSGSGSSDRRVTLQARWFGTPPEGHPPGGQSEPMSADVREYGLSNVAVWIPELALAFNSVDRDSRLPSVTTLLSPQGFAAQLESWRHEGLCPASGGCIRRVNLTGYRTGKRCTLQAADDRPIMYAKVFRDGRGATVAGYQSQLGRFFSALKGDVGVPEVLACVEGGRIVLSAALPRTDDGDPQPSDCGRLERVLELLARLHGAPVEVQARHTIADEVAILRRWDSAIRHVHPSASAPLSCLLDRVSTLAARGFPAGGDLVHRDFYGRQIVAGPGRLALLDLDTLCRGHGEVDLSTLISHECLDRFARGDVGFAVEDCRSAVAAQYRRHGGRVDHELLEFYLISALARLGAVHFFRRGRRSVSLRLWEAAVHL